MSTSPLEIPVGWTQGTIQVLIQDDYLDENTEDILVSLGAIEHGLPGAITTHQIMIQDNDVPPQVSFSSYGMSVLESTGTVTISVELNNPAMADVTVPLYLSGSTILNSDYTISTQSLLIPAGDMAGSFEISVIDDTSYEGNENVFITMGQPTNADLGSITTYTLLIEDNDLPPCHVGPHLLTVGSDSISLSMVNEGQDVEFTGGSIIWTKRQGNSPYLTAIDFAGTGVFSGKEKPTYYSYSAAVAFASLDTQVITYQFDSQLGTGTHSLVSNFQSTVDGTTCSLTETFTVH